MPSLQQITQAIGHALGDMSVPFACQSGTANTVILPQLVSGYAWASKHFEDSAWVYNQTQQVSRKVRLGEFAPLTGTLTVDPAWGTPSPGDLFVLTRLFPMVSQVVTRETSYRQIANAAIRWLWFEHQLALATSPGQHSYSLAPYGGWLTRRDQLVGLLDPPLVAGFPPQSGDWRRPSLEFSGGVPTLRLRTAYRGAGETALLGVRCPLGEVINGAQSSSGLVADADSVYGDLVELETVGLWLAYRTLGEGNGTDAAVWAAKEGPQEARARALLHFYDHGPEAQTGPGTTSGPGQVPTSSGSSPAPARPTGVAAGRPTAVVA